MTTERPLNELTAEDFHAVQGELFRLAVAQVNPQLNLELDLELIEVTRLGGGLPGAGRAPFSVLFHGPLEPVLPQAIYGLENERLGPLELFIVPIGPMAGAMRYEAVFG